MVQWTGLDGMGSRATRRCWWQFLGWAAAGTGSIHRPSRSLRRLLSVLVHSRHFSSRHTVEYRCNVNVVVHIQ